MTQRDRADEAPESPDLGASVQLEAGETLDGQPGTDGLDAGYVAPEKPFFLDDPDTTPEGQRTGDTLDARLAREIPDDADPAADAATGPAPDQTAGEIGSEAGDERSGRLVADVTAADAQGTDTFDAQDAGISGGAASAEEAAVHEIDEDDIPELDDVPDPGAELGADPDGLPEGPDVRLSEADADPDA